MLKIISGGQTGVDRAALDFALQKGMPCGGWCPKGRRAEDGVIPEKYPLKETVSRDYPVRTEKNILEADATLIITSKQKTDRGTKLTIRLCKQHKKPFLVVFTEDLINPEEFHEFLTTNNIQVLNIAGNRESMAPGIYKKTMLLLNRTCP